MCHLRGGAEENAGPQQLAHVEMLQEQGGIRRRQGALGRLHALAGEVLGADRRVALAIGGGLAQLAFPLPVGPLRRLDHVRRAILEARRDPVCQVFRGIERRSMWLSAETYLYSTPAPTHLLAFAALGDASQAAGGCQARWRSGLHSTCEGRGAHNREGAGRRAAAPLAPAGKGQEGGRESDDCYSATDACRPRTRHPARAHAGSAAGQ